MTGLLPFGGIYITGQSTAQALTSGTAAKLTFTGAVALPGTNSRTGDPAVIADATNSRIQVNTPGIYRVRLEVFAVAGATMNVIFDIRKSVNGTQTAITGARSKSIFLVTNTYVGVLEAYVEITRADLGSSSTVKTFADPDATAGAGKPAGGFAGAGAAPQTGVYLDVAVTSDASNNFTMSEARFMVERIG